MGLNERCVGVARKGEGCTEGKMLRGTESIAWKGERCVEGKTLRGRENVARKGKRCAEGKMLRGRGSVARGRENVALPGRCGSKPLRAPWAVARELQRVASAWLERRMPPRQHACRGLRRMSKSNTILIVRRAI